MSEEYQKISTVAEIQSGFAYPSDSYQDSGVPIVRMSDLKKGYLKFENTKYVSDNWLVTTSAFALNNLDFLLGMSGSLENHAVVKTENLPALLNQRVARLKLKSQSASYKYLTYWLSSQYYYRYADIQGEGAAQKNISARQIESFEIRLPGIFEQKKIATILTSIDTAIEKTEALIEKYQQIKAGLMHDLFTRGVLPNGQLRPPRDQAPELYQHTTIGWIPRAWGEPVTLESMLAPIPNNIRSGPFGSALLKHELVENGIPFLGIDNIHVEYFDSNFRRFVSDRKFQELARYQVRPRDVVITIMGTVGRCCVIPDDFEIGLSSKHLWAMTFDNQKVLPELICWQLNYASWVKAWFRRATQGGIMDAIQSSTLKTLKLPTPSLDEQILIFERYQTLSLRIQKEYSQLEKLKQQKLGLMQDLLTGKVALKVDEPIAGGICG